MTLNHSARTGTLLLLAIALGLTAAFAQEKKRAGIQPIAFTPDAGRLAMSTPEGAINIFDVGTGRLLTTLPGHSQYVLSLAISSDGRRLASSGNEDTKVWNLETRQVEQTLAVPGRPRWQLAFARKGRMLVGVTREGVSFWDVEAGAEMTQEALPPEIDRRLSVNGVAVSRDESWVVVTDLAKQILWNVERGGVRTVKANNAVCAALSPDNQWLLVGHHGGKISLWDTATGNKEREFSSKAINVEVNTVFRVTFSSDGKRIAAEVAWVGRDTAGAYAEGDRRVVVWEVETGEEVLQFGEEETGAPVFSPDGRWLAISTANASVRLRYPDTGKVARTLLPPASSKLRARTSKVARTQVSLRAGDGWVHRIELTNSGSGDAFGCRLGETASGVGWTGEATLWRLEARGKPGWDSSGFSLKDAKGRDFLQFCTRSERNERGVFFTETVFIGPSDARRITVSYENRSVEVLLPAR